MESLGISYSVGFYGFSLWLVGATVVVFAAAIGYAMWVGRDRPRAYHAFDALPARRRRRHVRPQDLLLFYVSFEAMLIPLYVLVGVWGGERRLAATFTFVVYTMAGSLLMLASVVAFGVTQGTFSLTESGTSDNVWIFLGFAIAFAVKAPLFPLHGWLPLAYREAPVEVAAVLSAIVSKTAIYGFIRIGIRSSRAGRRPLRADPRPRMRGARVRVVARLPGARSPRRDRVLVDGADGAHHHRRLRLRRPRPRWRRAPVGRARARLGEHVPARRHGGAALRDERRRAPSAGWPADAPRSRRSC